MLSWDNDNVVTADINQRMIEASSGQKALLAWTTLYLLMHQSTALQAFI